MFIGWDIINWVWDADAPITFNLIRERVFDAKKRNVKYRLLYANNRSHMWLSRSTLRLLVSTLMCVSQMWLWPNSTRRKKYLIFVN